MKNNKQPTSNPFCKYCDPRQKSLMLMLFLMVHSYLLIASNYHAYIKINTSECLKCYAAQIYANELSELIDVSLVFKSNDRRYHRYLKAQFPVVIEQYNVIHSDSLYGLFDHDGIKSHFYLFEGDELVSQCQMKKLSREFAGIKKIILGDDIRETEIKLPDTISYESVVLKAVAEKILMFNRSLQEVLVYNGDVFKIIIPGQTSLRKLYAYFDSTGETTKLFDAYQIVLKKLGKTTYQINDFYLDAGTAYLWISVPYPIMQSNGNLGVMLKPFLQSIDLQSWEISWVIVDENTLPEDYSFSPQKPLVSVNDKQLIYSLTYTAKDDRLHNKYLALFEKKSDSIYFSDFLPFNIPELHLVNNRVDQLYPNGRSGLIYHQFSEIVIDLHNEKLFNLPVRNQNLSVNFEELRIEYDYMYSDVVVNDGRCRFIYSDDTRSNFYGEFIVEDVTLSFNRGLNFKNLGSNIVFTDFFHLAYYDNQANAIKIIALE